MNTLHISIDIETMSSQSDAAVLSVGMCTFTAEGGIEHRVEFHATLDAMQKAGRHINANTVMWWMQQSDEARKLLVSDRARTDIGEFCEKIGNWIEPSGKRTKGRGIGMWAKGPNFDIAVMRSLFESQGMRFPIHYGREYCVRTALAFAKAAGWRDILDMRPKVAHGALSDAEHQANQVIAVMRRMKG